MDHPFLRTAKLVVAVLALGHPFLLRIAKLVAAAVVAFVVVDVPDAVADIVR